MADFFSNYIFLIVGGIVIALVIVLVYFLFFKKRKTVETVENVNEIKSFTSVPEFDQLTNPNNVKPFSEQDFNRQLMSQTQDVSDNSTIQSVPNLVPEFNSNSVVQTQNSGIENGMPNLVPEFNSNSGVQTQNSGIENSGIPNLVPEFNSNNGVQSQGEPQFIPQPDVFGQVSASSSDSSVESIDIVEDAQDDIVDVVEPVDDTIAQSVEVDFNSVFGQSSNGSN